MRWRTIFLFLFLLPVFVFGLDSKKCSKIREQVELEWKRHHEWIEKVKGTDQSEIEKRIELLKKSVNCCKRALDHCDTILKDIKGKSKSKQREPWRVQLKSVCKQDKGNLQKEIDSIQPMILKLEEALKIHKANFSYEKSVEKASEAASKDLSFQRQLDNVNEVVTLLHEVSNMYKEASLLAKEALSLYSTKAPSNVKKAVEKYDQLAEKYRQEAIDWPEIIGAQKKVFEEELSSFKGEILLEERSTITRNRPLDVSLEDLKIKEFQRRNLFFQDKTVQSVELNESCPFIVPLDGQTYIGNKEFSLYREQFYRFLIQKEEPIPAFFVRVFQDEQAIYEEKIEIPMKDTLGWDRYLLTDGMISIPNTKLQSDFGMDLRFKICFDSIGNSCIMIAQKGENPGFHLEVLLEEGDVLYKCHFLEPPPWQLGVLRKPIPPSITRFVDKTLSSQAVFKKIQMNGKPAPIERLEFPLLDLLVEELKGDPLLLAQYVYHEIDLVEPVSSQEDGVFQALSIHRDPETTYLEKAGSSWEQCQLLVYLLRKAGYQANYVFGDPCILPKLFVENLLQVKLPEEEKQALLRYPWVLFSDGEEQISLFPWMKEIQMIEGYDLYNLMPTEYASVDRWIAQYLKNDENILNQIGSDQNDTAAIVFMRFIEKELRKQGLSLEDVGVHRSIFKKQCASWKDFLRPMIQGEYQIVDWLSLVPNIFAVIKMQIASRENPQKRFVLTRPLVSSAVPTKYWTEKREE